MKIWGMILGLVPNSLSQKDPEFKISLSYMQDTCLCKKKGNPVIG